MARFNWAFYALVPFLTLTACQPPDQGDGADDIVDDGTDTLPSDSEEPDTTDPPTPKDAFLTVHSTFVEDPATTPEPFDWAPRNEPCIVTVTDLSTGQTTSGPTGTEIKVWSDTTLRIELGYQDERTPAGLIAFADDADRALIPDGTLPIHPLPDGGQAIAMPFLVDLASGDRREETASLTRFVTGDWTCAGLSRGDYNTRTTGIRISSTDISISFGDGYAMPTNGDQIDGINEYDEQYSGGFFDGGTRVWFAGPVINDCWAADRPGGDPNPPNWL